MTIASVAVAGRSLREVAWIYWQMTRPKVLALVLFTGLPVFAMTFSGSLLAASAAAGCVAAGAIWAAVWAAGVGVLAQPTSSKPVAISVTENPLRSVPVIALLITAGAPLNRQAVCLRLGE